MWLVDQQLKTGGTRLFDDGVNGEAQLWIRTANRAPRLTCPFVHDAVLWWQLRRRLAKLQDQSTARHEHVRGLFDQTVDVCQRAEVSKRVPNAHHRRKGRIKGAYCR